MESDFNSKYRERTKKFAVDLLNATSLWNSKLPEVWIIKKQIIRSGTSVAANFRAVTRSRFPAEHYSKLCIVVEEADETLFWLELIEESTFSPIPNLNYLKREITELLKIFGKAKKSSKTN